MQVRNTKWRELINSAEGTFGQAVRRCRWRSRVGGREMAEMCGGGSLIRQSQEVLVNPTLHGSADGCQQPRQRGGGGRKGKTWIRFTAENTPRPQTPVGQWMTRVCDTRETSSCILIMCCISSCILIMYCICIYPHVYWLCIVYVYILMFIDYVLYMYISSYW